MDVKRWRFSVWALNWFQGQADFREETGFSPQSPASVQTSFTTKHFCAGLHRLVLSGEGFEYVGLDLWRSYGGRGRITMLDRLPGYPVLQEALIEGDFE